MIITLPDTRTIRRAPLHNFTAATRAVMVAMEHLALQLTYDQEMGPIDERTMERMFNRAIDENLALHGMNRLTWTAEAARRGLSDKWIWTHDLWDIVHSTSDCA